MFTVAICLCDRAYGGPEEGGWWYDTNDPCEEFVEHVRGFKEETGARQYQNKLESEVCEKLNKGRRPIWSVLSKGVYHAVLFRGFPVRIPEKRPRYE